MNRLFRITFLCLILAASGLSVSAQIGELHHNWAVGVNAGGIYNSVSFVPKVKQNPYWGYTGGVTARYISEKYFSLLCGVQAELNYVNRGWDENPEDIAYTYTRSMNYLEIPFMAHLAYGSNRFQGFLNVGPQFSFLLSEKEEYDGDIQSINRVGKFADNKIDYGIAGGIGMELKTSIGNFLLEGRYYFGLSDFYKNGKADPYSRSAHTTISVRLSYLIDITD